LSNYYPEQNTEKQATIGKQKTIIQILNFIDKALKFIGLLVAV